MGAYFGVRASDGRLIAMAGERLRLEGYPEMSGICTHPRGASAAKASGARRLILHLAALHRRQGLVSWLQVGASNTNAIALYRDIGFETARSVMLLRISAAARDHTGQERKLDARVRAVAERLRLRRCCRNGTGAPR